MTSKKRSTEGVFTKEDVQAYTSEELANFLRDSYTFTEESIELVRKEVDGELLFLTSDLSDWTSIGFSVAQGVKLKGIARQLANADQGETNPTKRS
jgi:ribosomal protein S25